MRDESGGTVLLLALIAALVVPYSSPGAQPNMIGKVTNFKVTPEFYPAPNQNQMKSLLQGSEAQPVAGSRIVVKDAKLQTFKVGGERELIVETPESYYQTDTKVISSPGALRAASGDGRFHLEGEGFQWDTRSSSLVISNRVRTLVRADAFKNQSNAIPAAVAAAGEGIIEIVSKTFGYSSETGIGTYEGDVRVSGDQLQLTAGVLRLEVPMSEKQLRTLTAEQNVRVDHGDVHATGARAIYTANDGLLKMTGEPAWQAGLRSGRGDELVVDMTNNVFGVQGNASLEMPVPSSGSASFLGWKGGSDQQQQSAVAPDSRLRLTAGGYQVTTNQAVFRENVKVVQLEGGRENGRMECGRLALAYSGTNELQSMLAEGNVVIAQEDRSLTGGTASFDGRSQVLELKEKPSWKAGEREGRADLIAINIAQDEMIARGNAWMRLAADQLGASPRPGGGMPVVQAKEPAFAEVTASEYTVSPRRADFRGAVRITHPQMNWSCEHIKIAFHPGEGRADGIQAEEKVIFEFTDPKNQRVVGSGDKAQYSFAVAEGRTNEIMRLFGAPARIQTTNTVAVNKVFLIDLATRKISAPGSYSFSGTGDQALLPKLDFPSPGKVLGSGKK